jgi:hypothetical protein
LVEGEPEEDNLEDAEGEPEEADQEGAQGQAQGQLPEEIEEGEAPARRYPMGERRQANHLWSERGYINAAVDPT